jgi:hypothetical protein
VHVAHASAPGSAPGESQQSSIALSITPEVHFRVKGVDASVASAFESVLVLTADGTPFNQELKGHADQHEALQRIFVHLPDLRAH